MGSERLTAFTDGVVAVIITIMVLEMKPPHGGDLHDVLAVAPVFAGYVLSFVYVAIYWNNHHHFFKLTPTVDGLVLWANLNLLFWLSLIPFATAWAGEHPFAPGPTALYGGVLLACAVAWWGMQEAIVRQQGPGSPLRAALGRDLKGRAVPWFYVTGVILAFVAPLAAYALYAAVALLWIIPDRRMERAVAPG